MATPSPKAPTVVIVGAGFGGLRVARGLKRAKARVLLIDRFNHHLFQPLLYQVATAALSPADIAYPVRSIFRRQPNIEVAMADVTGIDRTERRVLGIGQPVKFDYLVLATGSIYNYFGNEKWAKHALSLKTIADATEIRQKVLLTFEQAESEVDEKKRQHLLTFVLVGGGPTGVEMAGALAELAHFSLFSDFRKMDPRKARIILLEAGPTILSSFPESLGQNARRSLERLGVEVRTGSKVSDVTADGVTVNGTFIPSSNVIWTAGVKASPVAQWLGVQPDPVGRVEVKQDLSVPNSPEIFVIGDAALVRKAGKPLPGIAPVAMQEGTYVANVILQRLSGRSVAVPFAYREKGNLATIGRSSAIADFRWLKMSGFPAWLMWVIVHIFYLIGFRNRLLVLIEWAWSWLTYHRGARLITSPAKDT